MSQEGWGRVEGCEGGGFEAQHAATEDGDTDRYIASSTKVSDTQLMPAPAGVIRWLGMDKAEELPNTHEPTHLGRFPRLIALFAPHE